MAEILTPYDLTFNIYGCLLIGNTFCEHKRTVTLVQLGISVLGQRHR